MSTGVLLAVGVCAGAHCGLSQNKKARRAMPWINLLYRLLTISENLFVEFGSNQGLKTCFSSLFVENHIVIFVGFFSMES